MVALLFVLVALGSLANSVEVRDHDNQLHKVSASLRRILDGVRTVPRHITAASGSSARSERDFVGGVGMLPLGFNDNEDTFGNEDTFDRLDFGEERMLPLGFNDNEDTFDRLDFVGEEGMLPAGFRPNGFDLEEADDVNVDAFDDFGNVWADFVAAEDPNFDFGFPGMHYDCAWTVGDGIGGTEEKISETLTERECMLACRSDGRFNGATVNANGQGGCWCEVGMTDIDSSATTYKTCRFDVDWILLRSDVECGNNENEVNLGTFDSVDACAEACRNRDGCTNFIYGKGGKAGRCWDEAITESACTIWEDDQYDFYKLPGTETVVNLPGF